MSHEYQSRIADSADESLLYTIFAASKRAEFAPLGWPEEQLESLIVMQYRARRQSYAQSWPAAVCNVLCLQDGQAVGASLVAFVGDSYRVVDLAILPEHQGRGLGSWAIRQLQQAAELSQLGVRLRVERENVRALALYRRLGFVALAEDALSFEMEWLSAKVCDAPFRAPEELVLGGLNLRHAELTDRLLEFIEGIGLRVERGLLAGRGFLPGIAMLEGALRVEPERLLYPGDLLHAAGHMAVTSPTRRWQNRPNCREAAEEMSTLAWSYAAIRACGLPAEVVFHPHAYRGQSQALCHGFESGTYRPGVPILEWYQMTTNYPEMQCWLRGEGVGDELDAQSSCAAQALAQ